MREQLLNRAQSIMPAGVNSPVRAFQSVGGDPFFVKSAKGARLETTDGRSLIDFCMSFGPLILGHGHPAVIDAIQSAATRGTSYAVTTEAEIELGEAVRDAIPSMEKLRLVNSGTEACMTAIRLARGYTGKNKILKFTGCYHGHVDHLLVQAGSGVAGIASASSAGVTAGCAADTLVAPYNDFEALKEVVNEHRDDLAAIIVEPIAANMGLIPPNPDFLQLLRDETKASNALLIFDEVITGFRLTFGGYQNVCGINPDLTCLGKVIGGGMPIGAVGGKAEIMDNLAPLGKVYQAGTLSGNPISVAAGLATLRTLKELNPYADLEQRTEALVSHITDAANKAGIALQLPQIGSLFSFFFTDQSVQNFDDVMQCNKDHFITMFHKLLERGIYLAPSPFEAGFVSVGHGHTEIALAGEVFERLIPGPGSKKMMLKIKTSRKLYVVFDFNMSLILFGLLEEVFFFRNLLLFQTTAARGTHRVSFSLGALRHIYLILFCKISCIQVLGKEDIKEQVSNF